MSQTVQRESGTEIRLGITDESYPFVGVSARQGCSLEFLAIYPDGESSRVIFEVTGASGTAVIEDLEVNDVGCELVYAGDSESVVSLTVPELTMCPGTTTIVNGGIITKFWAKNGTGEIQAFLPPEVDAANVFATIQQYHPSIDLISKQEWSKGTPSEEFSVPASVVNRDLTDRQIEVLKTAYKWGYFEKPRTMSGEEIAASLGISQSTFSQHLRAAQSKILDKIFGEIAHSIGE